MVGDRRADRAVHHRQHDPAGGRRPRRGDRDHAPRRARRTRSSAGRSCSRGRSSGCWAPWSRSGCCAPGPSRCARRWSASSTSCRSSSGRVGPGHGGARRRDGARARRPGILGVGPDVPHPIAGGVPPRAAVPCRARTGHDPVRRTRVAARPEPTPSTPPDPSIPSNRRPASSRPPAVVAPGRPAPRPLRLRRDRRGRLVAVLAGSALFVSGWSLGRQAALTPGTPGRRGRRLPAVLGHVPRGHRAVRRRRRRPQGARRGRDQGDDRRARRPVLAVPHVATSSRHSSRALSGRVRGDRGDDRHGGRRRRRPRPAPTLRRPTAGWSIVAPIQGSPAEKAGLRRRRHHRWPSTARRLAGLHARRGPRPGPRARRARRSC